MKNLRFKLTNASELSQEYRPRIYRIGSTDDYTALEALMQDTDDIIVIDQLEGQLRELVKSRNPSLKMTEELYTHLIQKHLDGADRFEYGVWVYYPWSKKLIHLLDQEEFIEIRTNRNRYKITDREQQTLRSKKIGIIGLSVGQSIALTLAMERTCGEIRMADFDTAELSNLNRIRTGVQNLGLHKTVIAAREIAEIDPYLRVRIWSDGIHNENIDDFFTGGGKIDLLVEVCDGLDVKIQSRYKARELGIPVVMDTNDRGMVDIERFDLEPDRSILHGLAEGLNPENIKGLTNEQKIPYILKIVGTDQLSKRLKASMIEVEQSINTWPQLASSVVLGGAITTDVCRRILLDEYRGSGRFYIDIEELISEESESTEELTEVNPYGNLDLGKMKEISCSLPESGNSVSLEASTIDAIIAAAIQAPSAGNNQPWRFVWSNNRLLVFHDERGSYSWGDYYQMGSHMSLGTAIENISLAALQQQLDANVDYFPLEKEHSLVASIRFSKTSGSADPRLLELADGIFKRCTNRNLGQRLPLPIAFLEELQYFVREFQGIRLLHTENADDLREIGEMIAACDRIRLLQKEGHREFFHEVRWSKQQAESSKDGIELASVDLTPSEIAGFKVASDWEAISLLADWNLGNVFKKMSVKSVDAASALVLFTVPELTHEQLLRVGRLVERIWIHINLRDVSVHPMLSPLFFFARLFHGQGAGMNSFAQGELRSMYPRFAEIFGLKDNEVGAFLMKVAIAEPNPVKSLRKEKQEIFFELEC